MKRALSVLAVAGLLVTGGAAARTSGSGPTVFAASSLTDAFPKIDSSAIYSFAGSNTLEAQIRQGAPADVFASANTALPNGLYRDHRGSKPVVFTRNTLVVIVPRKNPAHIHHVSDLASGGVKLVIAARGAPVGTYTLQVLKRLHLFRVLRNVVSRETDVREVLAKVALGEADAGFVYSTDAKTVPKKVRALKLPAWAQPKVQYGICVVSASHNQPAASAFVKKVMGKSGQRILVRYGFLPGVKPKPKRP
jgi:molybdate transport system substrate-binding protein